MWCLISTDSFLSSFQADSPFGQDLADAVDRAEWMEQSKNKKPAAKKMPKPKAMPESLRPGGVRSSMESMIIPPQTFGG